jgi:hypothetical protein
VTIGRDKRSQQKYREKFQLKDVPLSTPQSALDELIFDPKWKPRPGWDLDRGKDFLGNPSWIFTSKENREYSFDEMKLRIYRCFSFRRVGTWDNIKYVREEEDPPLEFLKDEGRLKTIMSDYIPRMSLI